MRYRKLGRSAIAISEISFGCMSLHEVNSENVQLLQRAFDLGINYFDTADLYDRGENEKLVGRALASVRKQVVIGTKVGNAWRPDGSGWDWNPTPEYIKLSIDQSLHRLQTDYIDLYQLHGGTIDDPIDDIMATFESLQTAGKIRLYGISSIRPNVIRPFVQRGGLSTTMMQYSLLDRRPEETCLDLLAENQVSVLARGVLAKGLLTVKSAAPYLTLTEHQVGDFLTSVNNQKELASSALGYVLANQAVASAVVGMRTQQHLESALQSYHRSALTSHEYERLQQIAPQLTYADHR